MKKIARLIEKALIKIVVLAFVSLVVVQGLMTQDDFRFFMSLGERMEGQTIEFPVSAGERDEKARGLQISSPHALLTLSVKDVSSLPHAWVLVNGQKKAAFNNSELELEIMAGDVVEIDSTYYNFPVEYVIKDCSPNLSYPRKGEIYYTDQGIVMIGKIIVK
ncbi:MAG: hypothetical protein ACOX0E_10410 [Syntrophomonadaceae bacterium]